MAAENDRAQNVKLSLSSLREISERSEGLGQLFTPPLGPKRAQLAVSSPS
jgi:hypothetical protein